MTKVIQPHQAFTGAAYYLKIAMQSGDDCRLLLNPPAAIPRTFTFANSEWWHLVWTLKFINDLHGRFSGIHNNKYINYANFLFHFQLSGLH